MMMKKHILTVFLVILSTQIIYGQEKSKDVDQLHKIYGTIVSKNSKPIEFANIVLYRAEDSFMAANSISDQDGNFEIKGINADDYYLKINLIGLGDTILPNIKLSDQSGDLSLGTIRITQSFYQMDTMVVQGKKKQVEFVLEKKIINVGKDIDAGVGSAIDILEKAPSVKVDMDGAVSLQGNSNVLVLVDGRPQTVGGNSVLSTLPASSIDKIEIISNPSAKYRAEGTAGIINIILKKKSSNVFSGLANAKIGTGNKYAGNANVFVNKGIYSGNVQLAYNDMSRDAQSYRTRQFNFPDSIVYFRDDYNNRKYTDIDNYVSLGNGLSGKNFETYLNVKYGLYQFHTFKEGIQKKWTDSDISSYNVWNQSDRNVEWNYLESDLKIKLQSKNARHSLEMSNFGSYEIGNNSYRSTIHQVDTQNIQTGENSNSITGQTGKHIYDQGGIDYSFKLDTNNKIESGIFLTYRKNIDNFGNDSDGQISSQSNGYDKVQTYHNTYAWYCNYSGRFSKLDYQAGIRLEKEDRVIYVTGIDTVFSLHNIGIFPSFSANYGLNDKLKLLTSFSKRKRLPPYWLIVPINYADDNYINFEGNPELKPEYSAKVSAGLGYEGEKFNGSFSFFRNSVKDEISLYYYSAENFIYNQQRLNVDKHNSTGIEIESKLKVVSFFSFGINGSVYLNEYRGKLYNISMDNNRVVWDGNVTIDFLISKIIKLQIINYFADRYNYAQGSFRPYFYTNISMSAGFFKDCLNLSIKSNDIFDTRQKGGRDWQLTNGAFTYANWDKRSILFGLTYKFNKYKSKFKSTEIKHGAL